MKSMATWKSVALCLCAVALPGAAAGVYLFTRPPVVLSVPAPIPLPGSASPAPDLVSSLNVRLGLGQDAIRQAIDTFVPREFSGREDDPIAAASNDTLTWSLGIGAAELDSSGDGALSFRIPLTDGRVHLVGRVGAKRKGGPLGWLTRIAGVDIDETVSFDGAIQGTLRPRLNADWTLDPDLQASVALSKAQAEFFGGLLKVSLRDAIRDRIDEEVDKRAAKLRQRLAEDGRIVSAVQKAWEAMHAVVPLSQEPPVWLSWQPVSLAASVPVAHAGRVTLTVGTTVRLAVDVAPEPPSIDTQPLPPPTAPTQGGAIALRIPVTRRLDAFDGMAPAVLGAPEHIEHDEGTITLDAVSIQGLAERLTVAVDVTVARDWLPEVRARLHVSGTPSLAREDNRLSLVDADFDLETRNALQGVADHLLAPRHPRLDRAAQRVRDPGDRAGAARAGARGVEADRGIVTGMGARRAAHRQRAGELGAGRGRLAGGRAGGRRQCPCRCR